MCVWLSSTPGPSVLLEAVWADILVCGTFSVLSFSYPLIALQTKYNTALPILFLTFKS